MVAQLTSSLCDPRFCIDNCHVTCSTICVIKTFADKQTQEIYTTGRSKRFPPDVARRARLKLEYVDLSSRIDDLNPTSPKHLPESQRTTFPGP